MVKKRNIGIFRGINDDGSLRLEKNGNIRKYLQWEYKNMIVIDIGNTNIIIGLFSKKKLNLSIRIPTNEKKLLETLNYYLNSNNNKYI